jgi:hypothetical protein
MIEQTTSTSIFPSADGTQSRRAPFPSVISSEERPLSRRAPSPSVISSAARNLSYGLSGGSSASPAVREAAGCVEVLTGDFPAGVLGFAQPEHPAAGDAFLELVFPATKYLRIFASRFGPSPRIASKSSTLLNAPYDFRICKIFSAVAGPIPGTSCSSSDVAALIFTGCDGGFFFPASTDAEKIKPRKRNEERSWIRNRSAMAPI